MSIHESSNGQLPVRKSGKLPFPCVVCVGVVYDSSLFSGLTSSRSALHLRESGIAPYSDAPTALCDSTSGEH